MSTSAGLPVSARHVEQRQGEQQPRSRRAPPTDRGAKITALVHTPRPPFQVHWFNGVCELPIEDLLEHAHGLTGCTFVRLPRGRWGYLSAYQAPELPGMVLLFEPTADEMPRCCLSLPGEACEVLGWDRLGSLTAPYKPTRVDFAFDDGPLTPKRFEYFVQHGYARTRARRNRMQVHHDYSPTGGHTATLGTRQSSRFLRVYDRRGFNRMELELHDGYAEACYELLHIDPDRARAAALAMLRQFVDFIDPTDDKNRTRCRLLPWWEKWLRDVEKALVKLPPVPKMTQARAYAWMEKALSPVLSALRAASPSRFEEIIRDGVSRWTPKHASLAAPMLV